MQPKAALLDEQTEPTRRCTGPRTPEGKEKSSKNSTKHGCCSKQLILPDEDPEEWERLKAGWLESYDTSDPVAYSLVVAAAQARWQLNRAQSAFDHAQYTIYEEQPDCTLWTEEHHRLYSKFQRYQSAAERTFQRAFQNIERLRQTQIKQEVAAFKEELDRQHFALKQQKNLYETALLQAKRHLASARAAEQSRKTNAAAARAASRLTAASSTASPQSSHPSAIGLQSHSETTAGRSAG